MRTAHNYSNIKNRDKKLYSVSGTTISQTGLSYQFLTVVGVCLAICNVFGVIICLINGEFLYNPIKSSGDIDPTFLVVFVMGPIGIGSLLHFCKIQHYRLVDFLYYYLKPKHSIDHQGRRLTRTSYKEKAFIERV